MLHQYFRCFLQLVFLSFTTNCLADVVGTDITSDTTWTVNGNPWIIRAPDINNPIEVLTINAGSTLTIEPGVIVQVDGAIYLNIEGTLIAQGTLNEPITFQSYDPNLTWRYIEFTSSSTPAAFNSGNYISGSILEYVIIESAGSKSYGNNFANGAVYLNGGRPFINNVNIRNSTASGIYLRGINNYLKISSTTITNNHDSSGNNAGGITIANPDMVAGANIEIVFCNITGNSTTTDGGGILITGNVDNLTLTDNTISENVSALDGGGIYISNLSGPAANYRIERNVISNNIAEEDGGGIVVLESTVDIRDNQLTGNATVNPDFGGFPAGNGGGGIYIGSNATVNIDSNIISDNGSGAEGGGVVVSPMSLTTNLTNNVVLRNHSAARGGGIYVEKDVININDNIVAENTTDANSAAMDVSSGGSIARNTITRNTSNSIITIEDPDTGISAMNVTNNSIVSNTSMNDVVLNNAGIGDIAGQHAIVTGNNIFSNGGGFYITNTVVGTVSMTATDNWFGTTNSLDISDNTDGLVDYDPFAMAIIEDPVPVTPPQNVRLSRNGSSVTLRWDASQETDVAGYTVYWGTQRAPWYENSVSAGTNTSHTITGLDLSTNLYFAVTAYDSSVGVDDPATAVNERQVNGHESWFSQENAIKISSGSGGGGGGSMGWLALLLVPFWVCRVRDVHSLH